MQKIKSSKKKKKNFKDFELYMLMGIRGMHKFPRRERGRKVIKIIDYLFIVPTQQKIGPIGFFCFLSFRDFKLCELGGGRGENFTRGEGEEII